MSSQEDEPCTVEVRASTTPSHAITQFTQALPDEVLIAILRKVCAGKSLKPAKPTPSQVPLSTRLQSVETVCRRWFVLNRSAELWRDLDLGHDPQWRSRVDYNLLNQLVYFSTGCRASLHHHLPRPCPIHTIDLRTAQCKLSASDLVKFAMRHIGPSLKKLRADGVFQEHNYHPLRFHIEDILYTAVRLSTSKATTTSIWYTLYPQQLLDHHRSTAVVHIDATLQAYEAMEYMHRDDAGTNRIQRLLDELHRRPPRIVLHGLQLLYSHQPRFSFGDVYNQNLVRYMVHIGHRFCTYKSHSWSNFCCITK